MELMEHNSIQSNTPLSKILRRYKKHRVRTEESNEH